MSKFSKHFHIFIFKKSLDLYWYVDNTLEVFYRNLKKEVFYVTLRHMWIIVVQGLKNGLKHSEVIFLVDN